MHWVTRLEGSNDDIFTAGRGDVKKKLADNIGNFRLSSD